MAAHIDIVFDGPPGQIGGRFVEVEDSGGKSISYGEWLQRPDGYWVLRIPSNDELLRFIQDLATDPNIRMLNPDTEPQMAMLLAGMLVGLKSRAKKLLAKLSPSTTGQ